MKQVSHVDYNSQVKLDYSIRLIIDCQLSFQYLSSPLSIDTILEMNLCVCHKSGVTIDVHAIHIP